MSFSTLIELQENQIKRIDKSNEEIISQIEKQNIKIEKLINKQDSQNQEIRTKGLLSSRNK